MQTYIQNCSNASESVTSYATIIIIRFEITANSENHINKPEKPAVCTSDKIKAELAEAEVTSFHAFFANGVFSK